MRNSLAVLVILLVVLSFARPGHLTADWVYASSSHVDPKRARALQAISTPTPRPDATLPTANLGDGKPVAPSDQALPTVPAFSFRVMSYNILYGAGVEREWDSALPTDLVGKNRLPDVLSVVKSIDPDIWGIEEANGWDRGTPSIIQRVADELDMRPVLVKTPGGFNLGLLTKLAILEVQDLTPEIGRQGAVRARLRSKSGDELTVFLVHLDPASPQARLCEVNALLRKMQPDARENAVLIGDMNFKPGSDEHAALEHAAWQAAAVEKSWGIDQIWVNGTSTWTSSSLADNISISPNISDHYPVAAEVNFYSTLSTRQLSTKPTLTPAVIIPRNVTESIRGLAFTTSASFEGVCSLSQWTSRWKSEHLEVGALTIEGQAPWQASVSRYRRFSNGEGVLLRFKFQRDSEVEFHFGNSAWDTDAYKRFGLNLRDDAVQAVTWQGISGLSGSNLTGDLWPKPDTWYNLVLAIDRQAKFLVQLSDTLEPFHRLEYRGQLENSGPELAWTFAIVANKGKTTIDTFREFSFDTLK